MRQLVNGVGDRVVVLDARAHDRVVAFLSHLPQLVAWALCKAVRSDRVARRQVGVAGPGFRDMTRLARSPRPLWREVLSQNRAEVIRALRAFERALDR